MKKAIHASLNNFSLNAEKVLNGYGIRALERGALAGMALSVVSIAMMGATLIVGVMNLPFLPVFSLASLVATATLGLAKLGAEKWTWTRAITRGRELLAKERSSTLEYQFNETCAANVPRANFDAGAKSCERLKKDFAEASMGSEAPIKISRQERTNSPDNEAGRFKQRCQKIAL